LLVFGRRFSKKRFQEMIFQMGGVFRNLFQETGFSGSDSKKAISKNAIPGVGFRWFVPCSICG